MRVLITGISGFIGQELSKVLSEVDEVHGLYETEQSMSKNPEIPAERKHQANLTDQRAIEEVITEVQPEVVVHLAAKTEVALSFDNYNEVSTVNYIGTINLAEACRKYVDDFKLFLMASTMETYGHHKQSEPPFTETTKQTPAAPYAVAKLACEHYLRYMEYAYEFPFTVLRQTNAYGRKDNDFFVVERIITQMILGDVCKLGEPSPIRNFIYISDLIRLYETILTDVFANNGERVRGEIFCTGPDNALYIEDLAIIIATKLGWAGKIEWNTIPKRPGEIYYLNSSNQKATKVLGWKPEVSLSEGLDKTIRIWRNKYGQKA